MKVAVMTMGALLAGVAVAMPSASDLDAVRGRVEGLVAKDVRALAAGERTAASVADGEVRQARAMDDEAVKYLLLQGAFKLYVKVGDYESAALVLETMGKDIAGMRTDVVVELCNKAIDAGNPSKRLKAIRDEASRGLLPGRAKPVVKPVVQVQEPVVQVQEPVVQVQEPVVQVQKPVVQVQEKVAAVPEVLVLQIADGVRVTFVRCPPKTFSMSDATGATEAAHAHKVTLTKDYWIATTTLPKALTPKGGLASVKSCLADLNRRLGDKLPSGTVLRLPTEAEWEGAVQGNTFAPAYDFEATCETLPAKYAKKYAWKSELDPLVYASAETDPCRTAAANPAWLFRQGRRKRFLLRPTTDNVTLRLAVGREMR